MTYRCGIDLGGTKIEGIVLDENGKERFRKRIDTEQEQGKDAILDRVCGLYEELKTFVDGRNHTLGIGTPGSVSPRTGLLKNSNTVCLNEQPVVRELKRRLCRDFVIQNDANCFALAEALHGAGKDRDFVFGVIMGTGCGGGLVYKGKVLEGHQRIAGEWGHMVIDPAGAECYCGSRGCVETFISGKGLEKKYQLQFGEALSLKEIVLRAHQDHAATQDFMNAFYSAYGRCMANLINILDPDIVILGGGVSNIDELYSKGLKAVQENIFSDSLETPIIKNVLGDSAGVMGAALIGI